jgi:MA3 domain
VKSKIARVGSTSSGQSSFSGEKQPSKVQEPPNNHHPSSSSSSQPKSEEYETKVKEGTAKRNITRKKTADKDTGNYNSCYKKQGGHGKGQWKEDMDPSYVIEIPLDKDDPIYDITEDSDRYVLSSGPGHDTEKRGYDPGTDKEVYGPLLTLVEFKVQVSECIKEYYDSCDADEVIRTIQELGCIEYHAEVVKKCISLSFDKGPRERELTSRLLTCLHPTPLSLEDMEHGFNILLDGLDDLSKDVPDAKVRSRHRTSNAIFNSSRLVCLHIFCCIIFLSCFFFRSVHCCIVFGKSSR